MEERHHNKMKSMEKCHMKEECIKPVEKCKKTVKCKLRYAVAYIVPQVYENLFCINDVLKTGTIFMDLYSPYKKKEMKKESKSNCYKGDRYE